MAVSKFKRMFGDRETLNSDVLKHIDSWLASDPTPDSLASGLGDHGFEIAGEFD